jgi:uncharacterized membrane protein YoaK (UPF0700 family)
MGDRPDLLEKVGIFIAGPCLGMCLGALMGVLLCLVFPKLRKRNDPR